jgi:hypothetical protein
MGFVPVVPALGRQRFRGSQFKARPVKKLARIPSQPIAGRVVHACHLSYVEGSS